MNPALRKGWCPGALRPMIATDGLLVRLRITGGIVPAVTARALADLADRHGNGFFDLSARANLQMRGVRNAALPALLASLHDLDLLDTDPEAEAVRNIIASPLAGLGSAPDIRDLVITLDAALASDRTLHRLPAKFGFLVDDGGAPTLAGIAADMRFDWSEPHGAFAVGLGGTHDDATFAGICALDAVVARATEIARQVAALQEADAPPRRMRAVLKILEPGEAARLFGAKQRPAFRQLPDQPSVVGPNVFGGRRTVGLAAPYGRLDAAMLRMAASVSDHEMGELRLTPWRTILVPGPPQSPACNRRPTEELGAARAAGFIIETSDPRLRVAACSGRVGCPRGTTATHADADSLADLAASLGPEPQPLHVSGCEKGCAKPSRSAVTLVGRNGRYDLVRDGRPGDPPSLRGLDVRQVRAALAESGAAVPA